jgi:hypothetical protein
MSKYHSIRTLVDGITFDSKREAARYSELKLLAKAGVIDRLEWQKPFPVVLNGKKVCEYRADFVFFEDGKRIVEDVKGVRTPVYRLKRKLVEALYGVTIREI